MNDSSILNSPALIVLVLSLVVIMALWIVFRSSGNGQSKTVEISADLPSGKITITAKTCDDKNQSANKKPKNQLTESGKLTPNKKQAFLVLKQLGETTSDPFYISHKTPFCIGSGDGNKVRIRDDKYVAKKHAIIYSKNDGFYIKNLSIKGTWINDKPIISTAKIGNGCQIKIGRATFIFKQQRA